MPESSHRKRILSLCETALGGVGRYQDSLRALAPHGYDLSIVMPEEDARILSDRAGVIGFRRGGRSLGALVQFLRAFRAARREISPDIYIFNSTFSLLALAALRAMGDRSPALYCAHAWAISNYDPGSPKGRVVRAIEGWLSGLADLVVNVSQGDLALARRYGYRGRQVVVENAVADREADMPPAPFDRGCEDEIHLLFVGRFDYQKGLDILLPAFARARAATPHLHLHLVGGPVRGGAMPDLPEGVTMHGWQPPEALDGYYAAADGLIVPSRWEGLPLIVPEALRNGTPVLVSDRSDMGALVIPGETGLVFALDPDALSGALSALSRPALQAMRGPARESYERRFTLDRFARDMAGHLAELEARR
ncbi:glycosyltransferase family 4 protein [Thioclava pacifica]|uniref:glycosyltransferase family 4 protein n=1 Tax=Thioclava pacifica TaxID=285109 RepID=UPI0005703034|nr:glycosyltransferase family 4 protein [Thioclava pacifica]